MSTETIEQPAVVDGAKIMREANEAERARREGKQPDKAAAAAVVAEEPVKTEEQRRRASGESRKWRELYELRGRLKAYEELGVKTGAKVEEKVAPKADEAPKREAFATQEEYDDARVDYRANQLIEKKLAEKEQATAETGEIQDVIGAVQSQLAEAKNEFKDWDAVIEEGNKTAIPDNFPDFAPVLFGALLSTARAKVPVYNDLLYHFAKNPAELIDLMKRENSAKGMEKKAGERIVSEVMDEFRDLCGDLRAEKKLRTKTDGGKVEETKAAVRASDDAARKPKPEPSESLKTAGGSPTTTGKPDVTKDPAGFMRWENEREKGSGNIRPR